MGNNSAKPKRKMKTSFMYPALHDKVVKAVSHNVPSTWFCETNSDRDANNEWATHIKGRFRGRKNACCKDGWTSQKVAILIRGYMDNGYNAEVFNQRCRTCNQLGILILDKKSYVERVAYRIQVWAGIEMERPPYVSKPGKPHETEYCEGCKRGVCRRND
ncbi:hypothetical protein AYO20_02417 [Fonsecaea nubica]|uniref:3CxxC-type domain-containing protein n=1 Tax=Fonsecaea nubica TaxID=856822 RepID=A0A178D8H7_9EURO|nr:hypothetical protein AYO20_02417 [Fonsecaea nubica]OAL38358.1 hypothetical protein AYO20_02417 [Fonsecaea nubica]